MRSQSRTAKILSLSLACLLLAGGCSKPLTDAEYLARAEAAREKGDRRTAVIELKNALRQNPRNIEARRLLGMLYLESGDGAAAEKELRRAIELGLAKDAVALPLAEALQRQGKNQEILDEIEVSSQLSPQDQAILVAYRGDAWLALGKPDKAEAEYRRALEIDPQSPRAKLGLAYLAAADRDLDRALALVDEALKTAPEEGRLWRYKAELHRRRGELKAAEAAYGKAIEYLPVKAPARADRALVRIDLKDFEGAAEDIDILKRTAPKFHLTHFAAGYLKLAQGEFEEAKEPLEKALSLNDRYPFTHFYLGIVALQKGELEQADAHLTRFKTMLPGLIQSHQVLALLKYRERDYPAARALLRPVLLSRPDDPFALNLMANIELASGHPKEGLAYLQKLAEQHPESPQVQTRLGMALLAAGLRRDGIAALEKVRAEHPELKQADFLLARLYLRDKQFAKAKAAIDRLKGTMPDHPLPYNLEAMWHMAQGDETAAQAALEKAWRLDPGNPNTGENLARLAFKQKRLDDARRIYEEILKAHPENALARLRLAELDYRTGQRKRMVQRLEALIQDHPQLLQPRLELAKHYLRFGRPQRAQILLEEVQPRHPKQPELLAVLTKARLAAKQPRRALDSAQALVNVIPEAALGHYLLAQVHAALGDGRRLRQELEKSLDLDPKFLPARLALIKLLALEGENDEVEKRLANLAKDHPDDADVLALQGWWAMRRKRPEAAADFYRRALERRQTSVLAIDLAKSLWRAGDREGALEHLAAWNRTYPQDQQVMYVRAGLYLRLGREAEAERLLRALLRQRPENPWVLNDLAWLLRRRDPKQALTYAEKAHELAPESAQIADTLGVVLLENGRSRRALSLLEQAAKRAGDDPTIRYHLALAQLENGQKEAAIATLKAALASKRPFPERQEAEKRLQALQP